MRIHALASGVTVVTLAMLAAACSTAPLGPSHLDTKNDACASCRMPVSDPGLSAQLVAPGEEPKFFDDIGCLREFLASKGASAGSVAYVADHRTRVWIRAAEALYTRQESLATPMDSHLMAHEGQRSRDEDPAARGGGMLGPRDLFGPGGAPAGRR